MIETLTPGLKPPRYAADRPANAPILSVRDVDFWYGETQALFDVSLDIFPGECIAFMGPSGCGNSTLLRLFNRMQDEIAGARLTGEILFDGQDVNDPELDPVILRRRFGWVAQQPNPFPKSVFENVAYGPRLHGLVEERAMGDHVRECLERAHLWDEVEDRLSAPGTELSGGQQQRLCIARALSIRPDVLLMDEPCSSIDPVGSAKIEELILEMKKSLAIVIITHNLEQARRLSDRTAFFHMGRLIEAGPTELLFTAPAEKVTGQFLAGVFG